MPSDSRLLDGSLVLGGCIALAAGTLVLLQGTQALIPRSFTLLAGVVPLAWGLGNLLSGRHPRLAARLNFTARLFVGFAIFALSWALSHP